MARACAIARDEAGCAKVWGAGGAGGGIDGDGSGRGRGRRAVGEVCGEELGVGEDDFHMGELKGTAVAVVGAVAVHAGEVVAGAVDNGAAGIIEV